MSKHTTEFDAYRDTYSSEIDKSIKFSGQSHDFFTKVKANYLLQILANKHYFKDDINALDVGCGHGLIHNYLLSNQNIKLKLSGVDVASSVIELARSNNPEVSYQAYDGIHLPYADHSFDIAYAICVMHHVPPPQWLSFLNEMHRVIKPQGFALIFEHNPFNPLTQKIVRTCPLDKDAVLLRSKTMTKLMGEAQLTVEEKKFILFTPFDNPFFHKLDRQLGWFPIGAQYYVLSRRN